MSATVETLLTDALRLRLQFLELNRWASVGTTSAEDRRRYEAEMVVLRRQVREIAGAIRRERGASR